jgi:hypothetical protein
LKAAIYSLQRGSFEDARKKLEQAEKLSLVFLPLITQFQVLRKGTFSSAIEEYVEVGKKKKKKKKSLAADNFVLFQARAFEFFLLNGKLIPLSLFGGLCDSEEVEWENTRKKLFHATFSIWGELRILQGRW